MTLPLFTPATPAYDPAVELVASARRTDAESSHEAIERLLKNGKCKTRCLMLLDLPGLRKRSGMTGYEVWSVFQSHPLWPDHQEVYKRLNTLQVLGLVETSKTCVGLPKKRCAFSGKRLMSWRIVGCYRAPR